MGITLADSIEATDEESQFDSSCKRLLSNKNILAWILKTTAKEFENESIEDIRDKYIEGEPLISQMYVNPGDTNTSRTMPEIIGMNGENNIQNEGKVTFDIVFYVLLPNDNEKGKIIVNVEAQGKYSQTYEFQTRGIYYSSRMISAQYGREFEKSHYEDIKKVYSIWICMNPPEKLKNTITSFDIKKEDVLGNVEAEENSYDLMSVKIIRLGKGKENKIIRLLETLLSNEKKPAEKKKILRDEYDIQLQDEQEVGNMSGLGAYIAETSFEKGQETKLINMVCKKMQKNKSPEMIADELEEDIDVINAICSAVDRANSNYDMTKAEYDSEKIYDLLHEDVNYGK